MEQRGGVRGENSSDGTRSKVSTQETVCQVVCCSMLKVCCRISSDFTLLKESIMELAPSIKQKCNRGFSSELGARILCHIEMVALSDFLPEITMLLLKMSIWKPPATQAVSLKPKWKLSGARPTRWLKGCNVFPGLV